MVDDYKFDRFKKIKNDVPTYVVQTYEIGHYFKNRFTLWNFFLECSILSQNSYLLAYDWLEHCLCFTVVAPNIARLRVQSLLDYWFLVATSCFWNCEVWFNGIKFSAIPDTCLIMDHLIWHLWWPNYGPI